MVPLTECPAVGAVSETVGGVVSLVTLTAGEVVALPAASRATAVRGWAPAAAVVVSHETDRKSTRLNSSHLVISYAVFCLKKKKNAQHNKDAAAALERAPSANDGY